MKDPREGYKRTTATLRFKGGSSTVNKDGIPVASDTTERSKPVYFKKVRGAPLEPPTSPPKPRAAANFLICEQILEQINLGNPFEIVYGGRIWTVRDEAGTTSELDGFVTLLTWEKP